MRKPNPFLHMMGWGLVSGTILALLFMFFLVDLDASQNILPLFINPMTWQIALMIGGVPGLGLGIVDGFVLWLIMRGRPLPFSREDMQITRWPVYGWIGGLTLIAGYLLTIIFFQWPYNGFFSFSMNLALFFPPIIAALASVYAGHRYLFRLRLWSEQAYGARKEKAKNDELGRLEDKPQNESYLSLDEALENEQKL